MLTESGLTTPMLVASGESRRKSGITKVLKAA